VGLVVGYVVILYLLTSLGLLLSAYVWYKQVTPGPVLCIGSGCARVIRSPYGRLLGIPNGALGVFFFGGMLVGLVLLRSGVGWVFWPMVAATAIALVLYLYLVYLQVFVLRSLCSWCIASALDTLLIFGFLLAAI
jgi:uncharacterized membrane protein